MIGRVRLALIANPRSGTAPDSQAPEELLGADGAQVATTTIGDLAGPEGDGLDDERLAAALRTGPQAATRVCPSMVASR
jgi:hypothetical protein